MKKIEDYLHLYLGCECLFGVKVPNQEISFNKQRVDTRVIHNVLNGLAECKPLLRPLSDLTEEECIEVCKIETTVNRHHLLEVHYNKNGCLHYTDGSRWQADGVDELNDLFIHFNHLSPEQTRYLLSKHFDLFGLIEAGLAIDKTNAEAGEK